MRTKYRHLNRYLRRIVREEGLTLGFPYSAQMLDGLDEQLEKMLQAGRPFEDRYRKMDGTPVIVESAEDCVHDGVRLNKEMIVKVMKVQIMK